MANVFDGYIDSSDVLSMPFTAEEKTRFSLRKGDILLNEGQSIGLVGRSAIYQGDPPDCCFQNSLIRFRPTRVDGRFAQIVFQRYLHTGVFSSIAYQTTSIAHLGAGRFASLTMPLPPMAEQEAIADALSDADALLESLERLIAKKRLLKQGVMQELLTGNRRLASFSQPWQNRPLSSAIAALEAGVSVNSVDDSVGGGTGGERVLKTSAVSNGRFLPKESKLIASRDLHRASVTPRRDTIILSRMNTPDLVGECGYVDRDYPGLTLPDRLWMIRTASTCARWLTHALCETRLKTALKAAATGTSGSMKNLSKEALLSITIAFPGPAEQAAIANVLTDLDAEIDALEAKLEKLRLIKQGMRHDLLTGKVRLT